MNSKNGWLEEHMDVKGRAIGVWDGLMVLVAATLYITVNLFTTLVTLLISS